MKLLWSWQRRIAALCGQRDIGYSACNRCWRGYRFVTMHTTPFHSCTEDQRRAANRQYGRPEDFEGDECAGVDCAKGASPFTFVFSRSRYKTPTESQLQEYRDYKIIVEAHGGRMVKLEYEFAGDNPVFTQKDEQEMITAVLRDNPDLTLEQSWNGRGCYSFSVGAKLR